MTHSDPPPEFSHLVPLSQIGTRPSHLQLLAGEAERKALARRFGLLSLEAFTTVVSVVRDGDAIVAEGSIKADLTQKCVATNAPVSAKLDETFAIRFLPEVSYDSDIEVDLDESDCDTLFHNGRTIDLGEAAAQSLGLAIDPYPRIANAATALREAGVKEEHEAGPFAALAKLRKAD